MPFNHKFNFFANVELFHYVHCLLSVKTFLFNILRKEQSIITKGVD